MWLYTSLDECHDLVEMDRRVNGAAPADAVEEIHDFDTEQIANYRASSK